tara:strand:+ start:1045 stop:1422 length:378 start_codon:yes stop_codon:yes gene_type:complete
MIYGDDNIHVALEKTAGLGGALSKYFKNAPKSAGFQKSLEAAKARGSKNVPGYTPRAKRTFEAFGLNTTSGRRPVAAGAGFKKTANIQMVKMFLRQGLSAEAAVKRAYPHWTRARRAALVRRIRG